MGLIAAKQRPQSTDVGINCWLTAYYTKPAQNSLNTIHGAVNRNGALMRTKICTKCKEDKDTKLFHKSRRRADGFNNICKGCIGTKENIKSKRKANLKFLYGLTPWRYEVLYFSQMGCCAICKTHQSKLGKTLEVDHDHDTGIIRGLLCHKCNVGLGYYETWKEKSRKYLKRSPEKMTKIYKKWIKHEKRLIELHSRQQVW